ncbi:serine/threonine protein phosphatase [Dokdonella sp.]|uniref:serine/threonine protein phosphatase n=1 Tax=Dokdonella sp. TaxID=2291710 RepID=UPI003C445DEA
MARRLLLNDRKVWLKQYGSSRRRFTLGVLDRLARSLSIEPLRPPPHYSGDRALSNELRRVKELQAADVNVPDILGQGRATLLLADIGVSLSSCLKEARSDKAKRDHLVFMAIDAIAGVHAKGLYLGSPEPRNMTFGNECIGFLDFEEDPGEVMHRDVAQARDWLMFVHGVAKFYPEQHVKLAGLLQKGLDRANPDVTRRVLDAGNRLSRLVSLFWPFGGSEGKIRSALRTLRTLASDTLVAVIVWAGMFSMDNDAGSLGWNLMGNLL